MLRVSQQCLVHAKGYGKPPQVKAIAQTLLYSRLSEYRKPRSCTLRFYNTREGLNEPKALSQSLAEYAKSLAFPNSTYEWTDLIAQGKAGSEITLHGYIGSRKRTSAGLVFQRLTSPDLKHEIQLVCSPKGDETKSFPDVATHSRHSPVSVRGILKDRQTKSLAPSESDEIRHLELEVQNSMVLNTFPHEVMLTSDKIYSATERYLEIRAVPSLREALLARSEAASIVRQTFLDNDFAEIETPILFKSTPEGAREFLVPSRLQNKAYALPQSPQQYKQILMASGIPRYFQIARCFRDEDLRVDRQPEFTQIDYEMAFSDEAEVKRVAEQVICRLWQRFHPDQEIKPDSFDVLTYHDAMLRYGSDKPDRRYGMEVLDVTDWTRKSADDAPNHRVEMVKLNIPPTQSKAPFSKPFETPKLGKVQRELEANSFMKPPRRELQLIRTDQPAGRACIDKTFIPSAVPKLDIKEGDILMLLKGPAVPRTGGWTRMGRLREQLHKIMVDLGHVPAPKGFDFLWIVDFPLFSPAVEDEPGQGGMAGFASTHHPFTAPKTAQDLARLSEDPLSVTAAHYDLVVNGLELGGGSRRIHNGDVQEYILRDVLRVPEEGIESLQHLIKALKAGCPPHAGMALGFDRLLAVLLGLPSVKQVIAFPKNKHGEDRMVNSPNTIQPEQLKPYHLAMAA